MYFRTLCLSFLLCTIQLNAAAEGTHVYFAEIWMSMHRMTESEQKAFVAGTLFPDIRYLGTISRRKTHKKGVTPKKIREIENFFTAGKWLHALVDVNREKFVKKSKILSHLKMIRKTERVQFLKLLEDEILWNRINCRFSQQALEVIYPEEIEIGVASETVLEWHQLLIDYFQQPPSRLLFILAEKKQGYLKGDAKIAAEWSRLLPVFAADPVFIEYAEKMISHLTMHFVY